MKYLSKISALFILFSGCSSQDSQKTKDLELTNNELYEELKKLNKLYEEATNTIYELKYGTATILQAANNFFNDKNYNNALELTNIIIEKHFASPEYIEAKKLKSKILASYKSNLKIRVTELIDSDSLEHAEEYIKNYLKYDDNIEAQDLLRQVRGEMKNKLKFSEILRLMPKKSPTIIELNSNPDKYLDNVYIIQSNSNMGYRGMANYDKTSWILKIWDSTEGSATYFESNDFPFVITNGYFEGLKKVKKGSYFKVIYEISKAKGKIYGDVLWVSIGHFQFGNPVYHELPNIIPDIWGKIQNGEKINYLDYKNELFEKINK